MSAAGLALGAPSVASSSTAPLTQQTVDIFQMTGSPQSDTIATPLFAGLMLNNSTSATAPSSKSSSVAFTAEPLPVSNVSQVTDIFASLEIVSRPVSPSPPAPDMFSNVSITKPSASLPSLNMFENLSVQAPTTVPDSFVSLNTQPQSLQPSLFPIETQTSFSLPNPSISPLNNSLQSPTCSECEIAPAVVVCRECAGSFYCLSCSSFVHSTAKILRSHLPAPIQVQLPSNFAFEAGVGPPLKETIVPFEAHDSGSIPSSISFDSSPPVAASSPIENQADPFSHLF